MKKYLHNLFWTFLILTLIPLSSSGQQLGDKEFNPIIKNPVYQRNKGPAIYIDEAHNNFHTMNGRYASFAKVLHKDGYQVFPFKKEFNKEDLYKAKILVISNALNKKNIEDWSLPTPSAFTNQEINVVVEWVKNGGSLFLIADHMPMPGAAKDLAAKFGFKFYNGFAFHKSKQGSDIFSRKNGNLKINKITEGRSQEEQIDSVATFTGQAFEIPKEAKPILMFDANYHMLLPEVAWEFKEDTKKIEIEGFCQGAILKFGKGRVAVFGEAAMFTSQIAGGRGFGLSATEAGQNLQFLLNIIHWLDGLIE